jgi:hypothetical protein
MRRNAAAVLAAVAVAFAAGACGDDEDVADVVPRSTPELTVPSETTALGAPRTTETSTTATTPTTTAPPAAAAPSAPAATTPSSGTTGGTPSQGTGQTPNTGGTSGQEFESFCADNPGAC